MSINVNVASYESAEDVKELHHLPCKIKYDGEANVSQFFESGATRQTSEGLCASFRGRPLNGKRRKVPEGYIELPKSLSHEEDEEDDRELEITRKFTEYTHWNLDMEPSVHDKVEQAMQWIRLSKAVHSPIGEESSQASITGK